MKATIHFKLFIFICLAALTTSCNQYDPYNPNKANLEGVWALDNNNSRRGDEEPIEKTLTIYATHMEFCPGQGTLGTQGQWRDGGFWCPAKDGSGEIEAAKVTTDDQIELNLTAFYAGNTEKVTLYKQRGSDEEMQALAAKYPSSISYPPPQGTITVGMTEYQLLTLPWKADKIERTEGEDKSDDGVVYTYHSDTPSLVALKVTVKNYKVVTVNGGNG